MEKITYEEAEKLLKYYFKDDTGVFKHSKAVSDFLYKICLKLKKLYPELNIDPEEMRIIGLLHDIGKSESKNENFHALTGSKILEKHGLQKIADTIKTHGIAKELFIMEGIKGNFKPKTLKQELLVYADFHVKGDEVVSFEERFHDLLKRNKDNPKRYKALKQGYERIKTIIQKIDKLLS